MSARGRSLRRGALVLLVAMSARAQPAPVDSAEPARALDTLEDSALRALVDESAARSRDAALPARERLDAAALAIGARAQLIARADQEDLAFLLLLRDQVEAQTGAMSADGSDLAVLLGVADSSQRARVRALAKEVMSLCARWRSTAPRAVERSERENPGDGEAERARLSAIREAAIVAPLREARAALLAELAADQPRGAANEGARARVRELLAAVEPDGPWPASQKAMLMHVALREEARAMTQADTALDQAVRALADDLQGVAGPQARAEAALLDVRRIGRQRGRSPALARLREVEQGAPFVADGLADPMLALCAADVRIAIETEPPPGAANGAPGAAPGDGDLRRAFEQYLALLERADVNADPAAWRAAVRARIESWALRVSPDGARAAQLPTPAAVALGVGLSRDPAMGERAAEVLRAALARPGNELDARARSEARWALAGAIQRWRGAAGAGECASVLLELANDDPDGPLAGPALESACALARSAAALAEQQGDAGAQNAARDAYEATLSAADGARSAPASIDLWRYELGRLRSRRAADAAQSPAARAESAESAAEVLEKISDGSALAGYARTAEAALWRSALADPVLSAAWLERGVPPERCAQRLLSSAERALAVIDGGGETAGELAPQRGVLLAGRALGRLGSGDEAGALRDAETALESVRTGAAVDEGSEAALHAVRVRALLALDDAGGAAAALAQAVHEHPELCDEAARAAMSAAWAVFERASMGFVDGRATDAGDRGAWSNMLQTLADWAESHRAELGFEYRLRAAWGLLLTGDSAGAVSSLARLAEAGAYPAGEADARRVLRALGEARLARGDDAGAFSALRELSVRAAADDPSSDDDYWHAWARMLEVLSRQNADGSKGEVIRREVTRIRLEPGYAQAGEARERIERLGVAAGLGAP